MRYFTLKNGEQLAYEDTGRGRETLVMLHGWTNSHRMFAPVLPVLRRAARCITLDFRGHGKSRRATPEKVTMASLASDLNELIRELDLRNITLLGWSMGAGVALQYTADYGCGALRQLILCDMSPRMKNEESWTLGLYQGSYSGGITEDEAERRFYPLFREFANGSIPRLRRIPPFLLRLPLEKRLAACDKATLISLALSMLEADYRSCVEQISVPVHYFYAVPGSLFSPALADWYRAHVGGPFHAAAFRNSSHMLLSDHPAQFAREVLRALDR